MVWTPILKCPHFIVCACCAVGTNFVPLDSQTFEEYESIGVRLPWKRLAKCRPNTVVHNLYLQNAAKMRHGCMVIPKLTM